MNELEAIESTEIAHPVAATVHIVDDDPAVRASLSWLIESVGLRPVAYEDAQQFLTAYDPARPGCLVLDVRLPGISGLELQGLLAERGAAIPIIIITGHGEVSMAVRAMQSGAMHFLEKPFSDQTLLDTIHRAVQCDAEWRRARERDAAVTARLAQLTAREREVMNLVVSGLANKQIAAQLGLSEKTVEIHRARVMSKMRAESLAALVRDAVVAESLASRAELRP